MHVAGERNETISSCMELTRDPSPVPSSRKPAPGPSRPQYLPCCPSVTNQNPHTSAILNKEPKHILIRQVSAVWPFETYSTDLRPIPTPTRYHFFFLFPLTHAFLRPTSRTVSNRENVEIFSIVVGNRKSETGKLTPPPKPRSRQY